MRVKSDPTTYLLWKTVAKANVVAVNPATFRTIFSVLLIDAGVKKKAN
jgi:hypothetical protein